MEKGLNKPFIGKEDTNIVKGVALVFMFVHHFFGFPQWYVDDISYPGLESWITLFQSGLKCCVAIFAFLTGYFYHFNKDKSYRYALRKCTDLWVNYFITFFLLAAVATAMNCYEINGLKFAAESMGLYYSVMAFAWYVPFYMITMFLLPSIFKIADKNIVLLIGVAVVLPIMPAYAFRSAPSSFFGAAIYDIIGNFKWFVCVVSGYVFARYALFSTVDQKIKDKKTIIRVIIYMGIAILALLCRMKDTAYDWLYAPMITLGVVGINHMIPYRRILKPLALIGKYSLSMWFLHGMFFNICKDKLQWILYLPKNPILVLLWGIVLCLVISIIIMIPINWINKCKNRMLNKMLAKEEHAMVNGNG